LTGLFYIYYYKNNEKQVKHLKTFEGLFDIFKKKEKKENVYEDDIFSCFEDLLDEKRITTNLRGDYCDGIFSNYEDVFKTDFFNSRILNGKELKYKNMIAYQMIYDPNEISDEEVSKILEYSRKKLNIYGCKLTLFIGQGVEEGWTSKDEYSNLEDAIKRVRKGPTFSFLTRHMGGNRNIIIKVKAPGDII